MNIVFPLQDKIFEWDSVKAATNIEKHGIRFDEAAEVFLDPFVLTGDATRRDEKREYMLGYTKATRLLIVVNIERGARTRIISARLATTA